MGFAAGFAAGLAVGLKKGGGGGGEDEWQPPAEWLEVPEPAANEVCLLIDIHGTNLTYGLQFFRHDEQSGYGNVTIDWGDGSVDTYEGRTGEPPYTMPPRATDHNHTYENEGQYVIKATTGWGSNLLAQLPDNRYPYRNYYSACPTLIAKLGSDVLLRRTDNDNYTEMGALTNCYRLHWVKMNGQPRFPASAFSSCYSLRKLNFSGKLTSIQRNMFNSCRSLNFGKIDFSGITSVGDNAFASSGLQKISLPSCTEIQYYAFNSCGSLTEICAPNCTQVGSSAFGYCFALDTAEFAENCTYGDNCFYNCYSYYPRPNE